jgi:hypothetical protein
VFARCAARRILVVDQGNPPSKPQECSPKSMSIERIVGQWEVNVTLHLLGYLGLHITECGGLLIT